MPAWALTLVYWIHMLATVAWLGSLAAVALLVLPAARSSLEVESQAKLMDAIQRRLEPLAWSCLALLVVTGMFQLGASQHYTGPVSVANRWSTAILVKHLLVVAMVAASAVQTWEVLPALQRASLRARKTGNAAELEGLRKRERLLLWVNIVLSTLVLAATAAARAS
jgi:uncharacterized membrane protein